MKFNYIARIWVIMLGVLFGFVIYYLVIRPKVLEPLCLVNTESCLQIKYRQYRNSVLVHVLPTSYWIWFDGKDILVYGDPTGRTCSEENEEPVFVYDTNTKKIKGYMCALSIDKVNEFYDQKQASTRYLFIRDMPKNINAFEIINILSQRNIINVSK